MSIDHYARAKKAWPLLVLRSRSGVEPFTYGELCAQLGLHQRAAQYFLDVIQVYCRRKGLPALQSFAVNKRTDMVALVNLTVYSVMSSRVKGGAMSRGQLEPVAV